MSIIQRINKLTVSNVLFIILAITFLVFPAGNSKVVNAAGCDLGILVRPSSQTVVSGSAATIAWDSVGCSNITLTVPRSSDQSGGAPYVTYDKSAFGSYSTGVLTYNANPTTYTYIFSATDLDGLSVSKPVTITVTQQAPVCKITSFSAFPLTITAGSNTQLSWSSSNCTGFTLSDSAGNSESITNTNSSTTKTPSSTTTYTLTDGTQTNTRTQEVTVSPATTCRILSFSASPNPTNVGSSTTISWDTANCTTVGLSGPNYPVVGENISGSKIVTPNDGDTWNLSAGSDFGNLNVSTTPLVLRTQAQCSIVGFSATNFNSGSPTTLSWTTKNCTSVTISGGNLGNNVPVSPISSGSITDTPSATTTYYLNASSSVNAATRYIAIATMNGTVKCSVDLSRSINSAGETSFDQHDYVVDVRGIVAFSVNANDGRQNLLINLGCGEVYTFKLDVNSTNVAVSYNGLKGFRATGHAISVTTISGSVIPVVIPFRTDARLEIR